MPEPVVDVDPPEVMVPILKVAEARCLATDLKNTGEMFYILVDMVP